MTAAKKPKLNKCCLKNMGILIEAFQEAVHVWHEEDVPNTNHWTCDVMSRLLWKLDDVVAKQGIERKFIFKTEMVQKK